jgi:hypothetical protein
MPIPADCAYFVDNLILQARLIVERGEPLAARAFVGRLDSRQIVPVRLDDSTDATRDRSARLIQFEAAELVADYILIMREAWQLPKQHEARCDEIIAAHGSIGASPFAQDVIALSLETAQGHWMAMPTLRFKPPSKKRRTFGVPDWQFLPQVQGRFVNLLHG